MSLDFPLNPAEGETYAAEGAIYKFTSGRWAILAQNEALTEIFGGDVAAGWTVFGDTLIQWGSVSSTPTLITYEKDFAALPTTVLNVGGDVNRIAVIDAPNTDATRLRIKTYNPADGSNTTNGANWVSIGEALDADKTPKIVAGADAASFLVPRSEWDIFKSAYEDTVRVLEVEESTDTNTYDTTNTSGYATSGPVASHTPLHPDSLLKVECAFKIQGAVTGGTVDDAGYRARLMRYNGTDYVPPSALHNGAFSEARYNNVDTTGTQSPNWSGFMTMTLGANERRSDNGNWTARIYYNTVYTGEVTVTADTMFRFTEYLPPGVT